MGITVPAGCRAVIGWVHNTEEGEGWWFLSSETLQEGGGYACEITVGQFSNGDQTSSSFQTLAEKPTPLSTRGFSKVILQSSSCVL